MISGMIPSIYSPILTKMKTTIFCFFLIAIVSARELFAQSNSKRKIPYDSVPAKKLGAYSYGMKRYVMAFLKSGKVKLQDSTKRVELQMAHLQNIIRLSNGGKLLLAGPFLDKESPRGIYIFNVTSVEEARKLTETDPAIQAGTLEMELLPWYGSAAIMELLKIHHKVEKVSVGD